MRQAVFQKKQTVDHNHGQAFNWASLPLSGINPPTTIKPMGNQTIGDTGLNIAINGVKAHINDLFKPHNIPKGTATIVASINPVNTQSNERRV